MAEDTGIAWAHDTVNGWWGCVEISAACRDCYAREWSARHSLRLAGEPSLWGKAAPRWLRVEAACRDLRKAARRSDREGRPRRVFMHSMSDLWEDRPDLVEPRLRLWQQLRELEGRITPLLLTKRVDYALAWVQEHGLPAGCWVGATVEHQQTADRLDTLLRIPGAAGYFASCEPLLGPLDLRPWLREGGLGWVIAGGESGGERARVTLPAWPRGMRRDCETAGVPFLWKQWGTWAMLDQLPPGEPRTAPVERRDTEQDGEVIEVYRWASDKRATGELLDGELVQQLPVGWAA